MFCLMIKSAYIRHVSPESLCSNLHAGARMGTTSSRNVYPIGSDTVYIFLLGDAFIFKDEKIS